MQRGYKHIGPYIRQVDIRNIKGNTENLLGVSVSKTFMPSIANTVGTDFSKYKVVKRNQFTYIPDTSRRGDKIGIALLKNYEEALVSQAYTVFEITDKSKLDPEYLMMWFRRPEFDRYARYKSHGSVREIFDWNEMCNVSLPIPSIEKQREIVAEYNIVKNRIELNNQLIQKLEETAQAIYKQWFVDFEFPITAESHPELVSGSQILTYKSAGGKMVWNEELDKETPEGWSVQALKNKCSKIGSGSTPKGGKDGYKRSGISLIRSLNVYDFNFEYKDLAFIDEIQARKLNNVELRENDILLNITGVSVARCCVVPSRILPARVNQHVSIIRLSQRENEALFLLCALCSNQYKQMLLGTSESGSTRQAITKEEIEKFEVLFPDVKILENFNAKVQAVFQTKDMKKVENLAQEELKNLLLAKMTKVEIKKTGCIHE